MKRLLLAATMFVSSPAIAQHSGHTMPMPQEPQANPHAGHAMPMEADNSAAEKETPQSDEMDMPMPAEGEEAPPAPDDPHAGHQMEAMDGEPMQDGHDMGSMTLEGQHDGHQMEGMGTPMSLPNSGPPPEAFSGPAHAADTIFDPTALAASREQLRRNQGGQTTHGFFLDRFEAQYGDEADTYVWDLDAWYGGDIDKFWIKSEGEGAFSGDLEDTEIQALWSHAIGPYFDFQTGVRYDIRPEPDRAHLVVGVLGLAPYFFELDAAAFLSNEGDLTARFEAEYDQRITQKLILQPRIEARFSAQDIPEIGIGAGLSSFDAGLRLRYEFVPQFGPYIGVEWQQQLGDTADFTRAAGEDPGRVVFLTGVRLWF